jgi:hypothetical protein
MLVYTFLVVKGRYIVSLLHRTQAAESVVEPLLH